MGYTDTLSILQTFLHFLKAKDINNSLNNTENNFPCEREKINLKFREIVQTQSFKFHTPFNICFRRLVTNIFREDTYHSRTEVCDTM